VFKNDSFYAKDEGNHPPTSTEAATDACNDEKVGATGDTQADDNPLLTATGQKQSIDVCNDLLCTT
jgi:hypothetical protein